MMNFGPFATLLLSLLCLAGVASCWPDLFLYTRKNPSESQTVTKANFSLSLFDYKKPTKLIIHGYQDSTESPKLRALKDGLLKNEDANVIMVDWAKGAAITVNIFTQFNYEIARRNCRTNGELVADVLKTVQVNGSSVHCIGHSLGAHSCGFIGKAMKLKRISGMDPACPGFNKSTSAQRLDMTDADWVDVTHTSGAFGIQQPIGHINFYPNGGRTQAGCVPHNHKNMFDLFGATCAETMKEDEDAVWYRCSHSRAVDYYVESLTSKCQFVGTQCDSYDNFQNGVCTLTQNKKAIMAWYSDKNMITGNFYLDTTGASPFCKP